MEGIRRGIVLATLAGADAVVGGLPLAARCVLALGAAGVREVAVLAPGRPAWLRRPLERRGSPVTWLTGPADAEAFLARTGGGLTLLLAGDVLVDADGARSLAAAAPGPVRGSEGVEPVASICAPGEVASALAGAATGAWTPGGAAGPAAPGRRPAGPRAGLAVPLGAARSAEGLERRLLDDLARGTESGDSYLAALIERRLSRPVTRRLLGTPIAPAHVTLVAIAAGVLGAAGLATVSHGARLAGVLLLVVSTVLDCVDGELARARLEQSAAGARLDVVGDYVVNLAAFAGLVTGLLRQGLPPGGGWAAVGLLTGVGAAMVAMHVLFIRPALRSGGDLHWRGDGVQLRGARLAVVAEKLASRDYTYLLLVLAILGRLEWFLYAAAAGSWAFVGVILAYRTVALPARRGEAPSS